MTEDCDNFYKCGNKAKYVVGGGIGWCEECTKELGFKVIDVEDDEV